MADEKPSTKHLVLKPKEIIPTDRLSRTGDGTAISVQLIHEQNRIAEERSGWGRIKRWSKRKSRRGRDFIILVGGFDLGIVLLMRLMPSGVTLIYGTAAITLVTSMFGWILFFVMDDY